MCTLTCAQDKTKYCHAHLKKTTANAAKHAAALQKFQNGARFVMSKVAFVTDAKTAYVSAPLKQIVDLAKTRMDPVLQGQPSAAQPVPTSAIAGSSELGANQHSAFRSAHSARLASLIQWHLILIGTFISPSFSFVNGPSHQCTDPAAML